MSQTNFNVGSLATLKEIYKVQHSNIKSNISPLIIARID